MRLHGRIYTSKVSNVLRQWLSRACFLLFCWRLLAASPANGGLILKDPAFRRSRSVIVRFAYNLFKAIFVSHCAPPRLLTRQPAWRDENTTRAMSVMRCLHVRQLKYTSTFTQARRQERGTEGRASMRVCTSAPATVHQQTNTHIQHTQSLTPAMAATTAYDPSVHS